MAHEAGAEGPTRGMSKMFKTKLFCKLSLAANWAHESFKYVPITPPVTGHLMRQGFPACHSQALLAAKMGVSPGKSDGRGPLGERCEKCDCGPARQDVVADRVAVGAQTGVARCLFTTFAGRKLPSGALQDVR